MNKEIKSTMGDTYEISPMYTEVVECHSDSGCMRCHNPCEFGISANTEIIKGGGYK